MTHEDLSARSQVAVGTIHRLESGMAARLSTIRKLAGALEVEPAKLTQAEQSEQGQQAAAA